MARSADELIEVGHQLLDAEDYDGLSALALEVEGCAARFTAEETQRLILSVADWISAAATAKSACSARLHRLRSQRSAVRSYQVVERAG